MSNELFCFQEYPYDWEKQAQSTEPEQGSGVISEYKSTIAGPTPTQQQQEEKPRDEKYQEASVEPKA